MRFSSIDFTQCSCGFSTRTLQQAYLCTRPLSRTVRSLGKIGLLTDWLVEPLSIHIHIQCHCSHGNLRLIVYANYPGHGWKFIVRWNWVNQQRTIIINKLALCVLMQCIGCAWISVVLSIFSLQLIFSHNCCNLVLFAVAKRRSAEHLNRIELMWNWSLFCFF